MNDSVERFDESRFGGLWRRECGGRSSPPRSMKDDGDIERWIFSVFASCGGEESGSWGRGWLGC